MATWGLGWFGGGQAKKEAPKKAILQLRGQLEMLNKREKHLQNQMDEQDTIARKYVSSNKNGNISYSDIYWATILIRHDSGESSVTAEEAVRTLPRANQRANHDPRARNLQHRNRKHQQGNARRNEERWHSHEADTRRPHNRQGR
jgi:hypothetical protein